MSNVRWSRLKVFCAVVLAVMIVCPAVTANAASTISSALAKEIDADIAASEPPDFYSIIAKYVGGKGVDLLDMAVYLLTEYQDRAGEIKQAFSKYAADNGISGIEDILLAAERISQSVIYMLSARKDISEDWFDSIFYSQTKDIYYEHKGVQPINKISNQY